MPRKGKATDPDAYVLALTATRPDLLVAHFLIHSFLYYVCDWPIIRDATFDELVDRLGKQWERIEHPHKCLIDPSLLKSGFYLRYPAIAAHSALRMADRFKPGLERPEMAQWLLRLP